eukprot:Colp12_sorted_trinity150504_noHs@36497
MSAAPKSVWNIHTAASKLIAASKPVKAGDCWKKPVLSARRIADLRKEATIAGVPFPIPAKKHKPWIKKAPKGHKHEREFAARLATIEENMKKMPQMIADYRKNFAAARAERKAAANKAEGVVSYVKKTAPVVAKKK